MSSAKHQARIRSSRFYESGETFSISDASSALRGYGDNMTVSRAGQILLEMVRNGDLEKVREGYRSPGGCRAIANGKWRNHTDEELGL